MDTQTPSVGKLMYLAAVELITSRYPHGWGGAAVLRTADNTYLTSVAIETANGGAGLCIETGAICEAHKFNVQITHTLCLVRDDEHSPFKILSPCGICQERLRFWGPDVLCAVSTNDGTLRFVPLGALQPFHWSAAYPADELEHFQRAD
jgi:cytidine deaminase